MPKNLSQNAAFTRSPNPLCSFVVLGWNTIVLLTRKKVGTFLVIAVLLFLILLPLSIDFPNREYVQFFVIIFPVLVIPGFLFYIYLLFVSPIYSIKRIEFFDEKDGFELLGRSGQKIFIPYQDIISIRDESDYTYTPHFSIMFQNNMGAKEKIFLPRDITRIYGAMDRIIHRIPKEKWGNIEVIDEKVTSTPTDNY